MRSKGIAKPLTNVDESTARVSISDDGKVIAFTRKGGLWAINSDSSGERLILGTGVFKKMEPVDPGVGLAQLDWIPNTHILLFNTILLNNYGLRYTDDLHVVNADTTYYTVLLHPGKGGKFLTSPDGKLVALITPSEIRVMRMDGSNYHTALKYPGVAIPSEYAYYAQPIWSSDSKSLMVAIPPKDVYYETTSPTTIWQLYPDGQPAKVISKIEAERGQYIDISPDFSRIAILRFSFYTEEGLDRINELHMAKIDGSEDVLYDSSVLRFINWTQVSEHFVYQVKYNSYQMGGADSDFILLVDKAISLRWVDASHFFFTHMENGLEELHLGFVNEPSILLVDSQDNQIYDFTK